MMALGGEGERVSLLARGQAWVARRIEVLLAEDLDPETRAFLMEMREQHLENVEACHRRAEELQADRKSTRLNSSHSRASRMPSSA